MTKGNALSIASLIVALIAIALHLVDLRGINATSSPDLLSIPDSAGKTRMIASAKPDDSPRLLMYDRAGTARLEIGLTPTGEPGIVLSAADGTTRLRLGTWTVGSHPELALLDATGTVRYRVRLDGQNVVMEP